MTTYEQTHGSRQPIRGSDWGIEIESNKPSLISDKMKAVSPSIVPENLPEREMTSSLVTCMCTPGVNSKPMPLFAGG